MISINNLDYGYTAHKRVFDHFSLQIPLGELVGLVGSNGVGKTTLLSLLAGLLTPRGGRISVADYVPSRRRAEFLRHIFYVPEEFALPNTTARGLAKIYAGYYPDFSREKYADLLAAFAINPSAALRSMSFGTRKKVFLAFALACNTRYLLLDEPTNGLDPSSRSTLLSHLAAAADPTRTIIISTHQISMLDMLVSRLVVLLDDHKAINLTTQAIGQHLIFEEAIDEQEAIYSQRSLHGVCGVRLRGEGESETPIDTQILYAAIEAKPHLFYEHFKSEQL